MAELLEQQRTHPLQRWLVLGGIGLVSLGAIVFLGIRSQQNNPSASITPEVIAEDIDKPQLFGSKLFYLDTTNTIHSIDLVSRNRVQHIQLTVTPIELNIAPDGARALYYAENVTTHTYQWFSVDFATRLTTPLHPQITNPTWSGTGDRILYQFANQRAGEITVAQPDGEQWQSLLAVPYLYRSFWWSPRGTYAVGLNLQATPPGLELLSISSKQITPLKSGLGEAIWSPDGTRAVLTLLNDESVSELAVLHADTQELTPLDVTTPISQITWVDNQHIAILRASSAATTITTVSVNDNKIASSATVELDPNSKQRLIGAYNKVLYLRINSSLQTLQLP